MGKKSLAFFMTFWGKAPRRGLVLTAILLLAALLLQTAGCTSQKGPPSLEEQAQALDKSLICPVCPGETLDQSRAELANQMRAIIREKLAQGETPESIRQFFVDRYGPSVLAAPPRQGFQLTVWLVPPVAVAVGGLLLVMVLRHLRRIPQAEQPVSSEEALQPYLAMVDKEMEEQIERPSGAQEDE
ncbi:MAG: cytochrome c-type biogenesis protein CcmH [Chloroflexi bacterium]|nr:cytochrome c-type biogenesis protein CcmH [Chloroflexota bacterium]